MCTRTYRVPEWVWLTWISMPNRVGLFRAADSWNCCRGTCRVGLLGVRFGHPLTLGQLGAHLLPLILLSVSVSLLPIFIHGIFLFIFICFHLWVIIPLFIHVGVVLPIFICPPFLTQTTPTYRVYFPKVGHFLARKKSWTNLGDNLSNFLPRILPGFLGRLGTTHVFKVIPLAAYLAQMLEGFAQVFPDSSMSGIDAVKPTNPKTRWFPPIGKKDRLVKNDWTFLEWFDKLVGDLQLRQRSGG